MEKKTSSKRIEKKLEDLTEDYAFHGELRHLCPELALGKAVGRCPKKINKKFLFWWGVMKIFN